MSGKSNFNKKYVVQADSKTFLWINFEHNALIRSSKLSTRKGTIGLLHWNKLENGKDQQQCLQRTEV